MNAGGCRITSLLDAGTAGDEHGWHEIVDRYVGAYAGCRVDQDLLAASLSFDSSLERVHVWRSNPDDARVLVFTAPPLSLELEVLPDRVVGQIVPPGPGLIVVETAGSATFQVEADDIGFFQLSGVPRGSVRLRCDTPAGHLVTDWICL